MLFHAAVALACGVLLSPAIDSTQAMEIFRNGQEAVGLSRVELSAESSALDLRETGKIACLQRRGLVSRRLKLIRRCQEKGLGDLEPEKSLGKDEEKFGHDDASHLMEPKAEESASQQGFGKGNPNPAFATGLERWTKRLREMWAKLTNRVSPGSKEVDLKKAEQEASLLSEKTGDKSVPGEPPKTKTARFLDAASSGLSRLWKFLFRNWAENGVFVAGRGWVKVPGWTLGRFTKPWTEMEKTEADMHVALSTLDLKTLYEQMIKSTNKDVSKWGAKMMTDPLAQEELTKGMRYKTNIPPNVNARDDLVKWAYYNLESLPPPTSPIMDSMRQQQIVSVKVLYVFATREQKPELARSYLEMLDQRYHNMPTYADKGIARYIHAAYDAVPNKGYDKLLLDEARERAAISAKLFNVQPRAVFDKLESQEDAKPFLDSVDQDGMIVRLAGWIEEAQRKAQGSKIGITEEESQKIDENADLALQVLFYFSRYKVKSATDQLDRLATEWRVSGATISLGIGAELQEAHALILISKSDRVSEGLENISMAEHLAKLKPTDWFRDYVYSENPQVQFEFHMMMAKAKRGEHDHLFDGIIKWAGTKITHTESTMQFKQSDILLALSTLYTHAFSRDTATAQLANVKLQRALAGWRYAPQGNLDEFTRSKTIDTASIVFEAKTKPDWKHFDETLLEKVAQAREADATASALKTDTEARSPLHSPPSPPTS